MTVSKARARSSRNGLLGALSIALGAIGWFASFQLLTEYTRVLQNPEYDPNCNISVLVTCGPNMASWQGSVFGFPNPIIGVAAFVAPIIVGVALIAGARFPAWFHNLYLLGLLGGYAFITWLSYQSIFDLHTLCPWCMVVWIAMIPLWWSSLFASLGKGLSTQNPSLQRFGAAAVSWVWVIVVLNLLLIAAVAQFKLNWLFTEFGIGSF